MGYPFPSDLTASATGSRIAWAVNEQGRRNIYVAEGPQFEARKLTSYQADDGQEISSLSISADGQWVVYLRGGEHGSNWDDEKTMNALSMPFPEKVQIFSVPFKGGKPVALAQGAGPVISLNSDKVAFVKNKQLWEVGINGKSEPKQLFSLRGGNSSPVWSPDGRMLAFVSDRDDHSFVGIYRGGGQPVQWVAPDFFHDHTPRWSPDGKKLLFVRQQADGGAPTPILQEQPEPWQLLTFDLQTEATHTVWDSPETLRGSIPWTHGRTNLHWGNGRIVFLSYHDGWPHLYSVPENGGEVVQLTEGRFMNEYISMSADGNWLVSAANTGPQATDVDRRHLLKIAVDGSSTEVITPGDGLEWGAVFTGNGQHIAFISATAQRPPMPAVMPFGGGETRLLAMKTLPADYPRNSLVVPEQVVFEAPDGLKIHATKFERKDIEGQKPAIVYIHGGPPRQMLLGWHYSSYYSNAYAVNQYLASQGFVVLSVNYRLGIGYGFEFHYPPGTSWRGAAEYQDIQAAGEWLAAQPQVDSRRIGVYGGSYGGYLTAMALGKDSRLFAAGVDIHGVHDRSAGRVGRMLRPDNYELAPDAQYAAEVAWKSSPVAWLDGWTSPVMIIHGDDDRNVAFSQSTDLVQRLRKKGVPMETLVIVDDSHHFMLHRNQMKVNQATADFLQKYLMPGPEQGR